MLCQTVFPVLPAYPETEFSHPDACYSHTISTHLIRHNKNNIGLLLFHTLLHVPGDSHAPYILPCYADIAVVQNQLTEHGVCQENHSLV